MFTTSPHTGQYPNFSSFEPFSCKTAWVESLYHRALKLCSNNCLFENQVRKLKLFVSWNGFPGTIRSLLISKLKNKPSNTCQTRTDETYARPKIWLCIPLPWQARRKFNQKSLKKLQRNLNVSVNFIMIYNTKKNCCISCPIKIKFQNYPSLKFYMKYLSQLL